MVQGKPPVRPGFNVKVRHSSVFFVEKEDIARKTWAGIHLLLRMLTSADHLHVHPLRMQPRDGTEANEVFVLHPSTRGIPHIG